MFEHAKQWLLIATTAAALVVVAPVRADDAKKPAEAPKPVQKAPPPKESATEPKIKNDGWLKRHEGFMAELAKVKGNVDLLFVGDSITDGWRGGGKAVWAQTWAPLKAFNIGIGGDRTQHVLWRLENGEMNGITPKLAVLMIGTNNFGGGNTNEEVAEGITACVKSIHKHSSTTKVLLLGIFPRGAQATHPARARIKDINTAIAKLDDGGKTVKYLDIGAKFLDAEGNLPKDIMPDALHPNAKGYQIWADAIKDTVAEMMK
jgi:lysophospholipase L1-like esterase